MQGIHSITSLLLSENNHLLLRFAHICIMFIDTFCLTLQFLVTLLYLFLHEFIEKVLSLYDVSAISL